MTYLLDLRDDQRWFISEIDYELAEHRHVVGQAPTGYGKTVVASFMAYRCGVEGKRMLFIAPALTLIDQSVARFQAAGVEDIGVIQADHWMTDPSKPIQIASLETLRRRNMPQVDLVVIDEVHRWSKAFPQWLADAWKDIPVIGLSATPWTKGLGKYFSKLVVGGTTKSMIGAGHLSPFKVFAPSSPDLKGVRTFAGDYSEGDLGRAMNKTKLVADVVSTWLERGQNRPTLLFAVNCAHAQHLQEQFIASGVSTEYIDANTPSIERAAIAERFHNGETKIVCNVGCLTTGVDWDVRCIVLVRPTKSEMLFVQMVGRGLRTASGKDHCLILDHSDNHLRLGFVTDIHHDKLDDGIKREALGGKQEEKPEALPKRCPSCQYLNPPKVYVCQCCGFTPKPKTDIINRQGELIELASRRAVIQPSPEEKQTFYAELRYIALDRGYAQGWSAHKFKARYGHFPPWGWNSHQHRKPSPSTLRWVKSKQIAFAKAERRRV